MAGNARRQARQLGLLTLVLLVTAGLGWSLDRARQHDAPARSTPTSSASIATASSTASTATATTPTRANAARSSAALPPVPTGPALPALDRLVVSDHTALTGYDRTLFGQTWLDTDRNGCDTRNDVLRRDLASPQVKPGTHGCLVLSGTLTDPYTGHALAFRRGAASGDVQVDHVVALADAWQTGAAGWSAPLRSTFANDPLELLATAGAVNQAKSDGDAARWLPPDPAYRCPYAARQVAVKLAYGLSVTTAEADALRVVLGACPTQPLPARMGFVLGPP